MKYHIDALVDCVFKALLGREHNKNLLLNFLNAILKPTHPLVNVTLLNPYNEKEYLTDKLSIVDVKAVDDQQQVALSDHCQVHLLELAKWHKLTVDDDLDRWLLFFKLSAELDANQLPAPLQTDIMRQAMSTLREFSEKERERDLYRQRLDYLRDQGALQAQQEEDRRLLEESSRRLEEERRLREKAEQEVEQLREKLKKLGVDSESL